VKSSDSTLTRILFLTVVWHLHQSFQTEKSKGVGNAKNGNAYLSWAFTELANLVVRFNPEAKRYYDRLFNRSRLRVKAIRSLAAKMARAIFMMLKHGETFDLKRCFGC